MPHCLKQCFFTCVPCIACLRTTWGALGPKEPKFWGMSPENPIFFNMHHPIPQEILELAKYEACQPEAVILNLGCTLQSPRKLKKNCRCLNSIPRVSDLNDLGGSLGIGIFFKTPQVSICIKMDYICLHWTKNSKTPVFILSQKRSPRMANSEPVCWLQEVSISVTHSLFMSSILNLTLWCEIIIGAAAMSPSSRLEERMKGESHTSQLGLLFLSRPKQNFFQNCIILSHLTTRETRKCILLSLPP